MVGAHRIATGGARGEEPLGIAASMGGSLDGEIDGTRFQIHERESAAAPLARFLPARTRSEALSELGEEVVVRGLPQKEELIPWLVIEEREDEAFAQREPANRLRLGLG